MKNYLVLHILLFVIFMLVYQCSSAQGDYLVTTRGDTVKGELKLLFYGPEKKVQVKTEKEKTIYSILNTKSFYYQNEIHQPVKGPDGYVFMKLLKPGYLSLLAFQMDKVSSYDGRFLLKADGNGMEVPNLGFKKQMSKFLSDCDAVSVKLDQDVYSKKDLDVIVEEYNKCITGKTNEVERAIERERDSGTKTNSWDALADSIKQQPDFEGKATALEMTTDIKRRIQQGEKVPNFVIDGLKSTLAQQPDLKEALEKALSEIGY